jgi:hypothetical protein
MHVFQDGSRRSSRCKPGDRNFGGVAIAARKRASGDWEEEKSVGESTYHRHFRSTGTYTGARRETEGVGAPALLLTCVVVVRSVPGSRRPPVPVAVVAAFESCMLTMRIVRNVVWVCARLRKARVSVVDDLRWRCCCPSPSWELWGTVGAEHHCCAERVED